MRCGFGSKGNVASITVLMLGSLIVAIPAIAGIQAGLSNIFDIGGEASVSTEASKIYRSVEEVCSNNGQEGGFVLLGKERQGTYIDACDEAEAICYSDQGSDEKGEEAYNVEECQQVEIDEESCGERISGERVKYSVEKDGDTAVITCLEGELP